MNASVSRITGVMCSMAMRAASKAIVKQSVGEAAATTHRGLSPVASVQRLHQVRLLGLGGQAGGGSAALHVYGHERQLRYHGQASASAFQLQAGGPRSRSRPASR